MRLPREFLCRGLCYDFDRIIAEKRQFEHL
jgi:hypothetical protein